MTAHRDLKNIIRDRQVKAGESYTSARCHVMRERTVTRHPRVNGLSGKAGVTGSIRQIVRELA